MNEYLYLLFSKKIYDFYIEGRNLIVLANARTSKENYALTTGILEFIRDNKNEIEKIVFKVDTMVKLKIDGLEVIPRFEVEEDMCPYVIKKMRFLNTETDKIRWCWTIYNMRRGAPEMAYVRRKDRYYKIYATYNNFMISGYVDRYSLDENCFIRKVIERNIWQLEDYLEVTLSTVQNIEKSVELLRQLGGIDNE